ncbi:MAG: hypothetical protein CM1200mP30_23580 [Pseudomonadota bacterium]|nr:MAG: hypothetical protein CM1200mP30_23580 [Pseudomonadota bacterium]
MKEELQRACDDLSHEDFQEMVQNVIAWNRDLNNIRSIYFRD